MQRTQDKGDWNLYVMEHAPASGAFLQSWEWGQVKASLGYAVERWHALEARCQVVTMPLPAGKQYLYVGRGPVGESQEAERALVAQLKQQEAGLFLRIDGARRVLGRTVSDVQPSTTLLTHLQQSTDELLSAMHSKTRYNIRLAGKKGVQVQLDAGQAGFDAFVQLTQATYKRHGITAHTAAHYKAILDHLNGDHDAPKAFVATATHEGDVLAATLMIDWNGVRTYLHGASSDHKKNLMAPYLLHWELMQQARTKGMETYDWWGIAPEGSKNHPWSGVTRFKKGFHGEVVTLPGTVDVVMHPLWYGLYRLVKRFK